MQEKERVHLSKFLSLILRHQPDEIGVALDPGGWVEIEELIRQAKRHGVDLDRAAIGEITRKSAKERFEISPDGERIRARYGHSIKVDLGYQPQPPPQILYHGTAQRFLPDIQRQGLQPLNRRYVHLSVTRKDARQVGGRHGKPTILEIQAGEMAEDGYAFFSATDLVWLVKEVPPPYLTSL